MDISAEYTGEQIAPWLVGAQMVSFMSGIFKDIVHRLYYP
jgi:hypothetical protein